MHKLEPYKRGLDDLAYRWKLRAPWAADELLCEDIDNVTEEIFKAAGVAWISEQFKELPEDWLGMTSHFVPPLKMEVTRASFLTGGRTEILAQLSNLLAVYETRLKLTGAQELPSSLKTHAKWWFQHHVRCKTYDEIAQLEVYTPGGKLVSYAKNVGAAV